MLACVCVFPFLHVVTYSCLPPHFHTQFRWQSFWDLLDAYIKDEPAAVAKMSNVHSTLPKSLNSLYTREVHDILAKWEAKRPANNGATTLEGGDPLSDVEQRFGFETTPLDSSDDDDTAAHDEVTSPEKAGHMCVCPPPPTGQLTGGTLI